MSMAGVTPRGPAGTPPPPDLRERLGPQLPELRWPWNNIRQLVPTVNAWRGAGPASVLPREEHDIGASASVTMDGRPMTFARMCEGTYADGIAVLHRGKLIYERHFGALTEAYAGHPAPRLPRPLIFSPRVRLSSM